MTFQQSVCSLAAMAVVVCGTALAQEPAGLIVPKGPARPANADGVYLALRSALPVGDGVQVKDFKLERQGGIFHFDQGSFFFYGPVNGRVTGAVFEGSGRFTLAPKEVSEQRSLALLDKSGEMSQDFSTVVLRFTDGTAEEIRKASAGSAGATTSQAGSAGAELAKSFRRTLHENLELRLLSDVLDAQDAEKEQFFLASFRMGGTFTGHNVLFVVDPESVPDQVQLDTWGDEGQQTWVGYAMAGARDDSGVPVHVTVERLDVHFERSGAMKNAAETTVKVRRDGLRVVQFNLFPTLRVSGVFDENGEPVDFVQENKDYDPEFAVVLPKGAKQGETLRLLTNYGGPDALRRDGDQMYYLQPQARESWYPAGDEQLGGFADFNMTFHVPKNLQVIATGKEISHEAEPGGGQRVVWATQFPIAVAGFNLGDFKSSEEKTPQGFVVDAYANTELPDSMKAMAENGSLGSMTTISALKDETSQGSVAVQVYSDYFGKLPYDHVALTEQSACNFGQSWPMLVYLPICGFWDSTIQERLGLLNQNASYWKEVTPHEVSHQWWGQEVGFSSYRDQWMSEGFANFSVSLFLAATNKNLNEFHDFWSEQHQNLVQKNKFGKRPIDVGPLTMGDRVSNEKTGNVYQDLIYSKGAFVMHMLQVMYWTPQQGEAPFKHSMQTFVKEYAGKAATTEDLQRSFESTMPKWLDLRRDGKLDWFFNEYVYGTELPHYEITSEFTTADGETSAHFKVTQSNVSKDFLMVVPLYLQMADGRTVRILNLGMPGDATIERTVKLGKLPSPAKKLLLNYNWDVLSN
jgi:Peptidase family M1 domain